jgi:hypothetical protein
VSPTPWASWPVEDERPEPDVLTQIMAPPAGAYSREPVRGVADPLPPVRRPSPGLTVTRATPVPPSAHDTTSPPARP